MMKCHTHVAVTDSDWTGLLLLLLSGWDGGSNKTHIIHFKINPWLCLSLSFMHVKQVKQVESGSVCPSVGIQIYNFLLFIIVLVWLGSEQSKY